MAQSALPVWKSAGVYVRSQPFQNKTAHLPADTHALVEELYTVAECQTLSYKMVEDQVEGALLEEVRADVQVSCILGAERESFLYEAMGRDVGVSC